ncbi:MAG: hypothetical protein NVS3B19_04330 [Ginsengibacter sp.]
MNALIKPYADNVHKSMSDVVATAATPLDKKLPESTLGNLMADIMLIKAKEKYQIPIDISIMNYGGIRLPTIAAGPITRGKIFELSPFDNLVVVQVLNGKLLQQFLDHIASKGGWPVSGMSFMISNKKATNVKINGNVLDENKNYIVALLDYVANGGDDASMLRNTPQNNMGYIYRDAILEYMADMTKNGKLISSQIENRVVNVN